MLKWQKFTFRYNKMTLETSTVWGKFSSHMKFDSLAKK